MKREECAICEKKFKDGLRRLAIYRNPDMPPIAVVCEGACYATFIEDLNKALHEPRTVNGA